MSMFLSIVDVLSCEVFSDFNNGKVSKIGPTFDDHRVTNFLLYNQMIMPTQDQIDSFNILSQLYIIVFHHMSECDNHITFVGFLELSDHVVGKLQEVNIMTEFFVKWVKCVNPLFLCQTKESNFESVFINNFELQGIC